MKVTEQMLCIAMNAHRIWLNNNCSKKERLAGIDSFGAWRAALEAVFSLEVNKEDVEKEKIPTLLKDAVERCPSLKTNGMTDERWLLSLVSEYLEKYMKEKD